MEWNEKILESAKQGNLESIKQCLANGADINAKDKKFGTTPLMYASYSGNDAKQRLEIVKYLISNGAKVNEKSNYGDTALIRAMFANDFEIVKLLIKNGADINIKNRYGKTALDRAEHYFKLKNQNDNKIIKYLKTYSQIKIKSNDFEMGM